MTIQDYMMKQVPLKMQAEMAMKQGNYELAADKIYEFAKKCSEADQHFPPKDFKTDQTISVGFNTATLMFNQILEATATPIPDPGSDNPYHSKTTLRCQSNVPEIIADSGLDVAYLALAYTNIVYISNSTGTTAMGFLNAASLYCNIACYYNNSEHENSINESLPLLEEAIQVADLLISNFPQDANVKNMVRNFYILVSKYYQHYGSCAGNMDTLLDYELKSAEIMAKVVKLG